MLHLVGLLSSHFVHDARSQEPKTKLSDRHCVSGNYHYRREFWNYYNRIFPEQTKNCLDRHCSCQNLNREPQFLQANEGTVSSIGHTFLIYYCNPIMRYGPKYENGEWKSRTNQKLEEMSKGENIVKWIKGQRMSWLGHLERMEEDRMPKKIFTQELEGTR